jgi:alpha-N-arabinofuranosidase
MMEWVEYMTSDADSPMTNWRRRNGRQEPWKLPYFGVGNESWGCGGSMRSEFYADNYRRYNTFVKNYAGNRIHRIACGSSGDDFAWTEVLMQRAGRQMDGLSLHWYTLPTGNWSAKGSSTEFGEDQWHSTMAQTLRMDALIHQHSAIMDNFDPDKKVGMVVDEWGTWYDPEPGKNPAFLYQENTMRDAVVAALNLHIFHRYCDRVTMANIAQTVNVLQAVVLTDRERMVLTPTYHVFEMYKVHQGATLIPVDLQAPGYELDGTTIPSIHASASRDSAGLVHLSMVNLHARSAARVDVAQLEGPVSGRILTASTPQARNTFDVPHAVVPHPFEGFTCDGPSMSVVIPPHSVVVLRIG